MFDCTSSRESPTVPVNRFDQLIRHIQILSESVLRGVHLDPILFDSVGGTTHVAFTQTKSLVLIVEKLRELFHLNQMVNNHLNRYRHIIERLLYDFRRDIQLGVSCANVRDERSHELLRDNVRDVFAAENNSMRHLKLTIETELHQINSVTHELAKIRDYLSRLIERHTSLLNDVFRTRRLLYSTATDIKMEPKLVEYFNQSYCDLWSPSTLMKNIETACNLANRVRMDLIQLLDRFPQFVQKTRRAINDALTTNSAGLMRDWTRATLTDLKRKKAHNRSTSVECKLRSQDPINREAIKSIEHRNYQLELSKSKLDQHRMRLKREMQTNLQLLRLRRRENTERFYPRVDVKPLSIAGLPVLATRS